MTYEVSIVIILRHSPFLVEDENDAAVAHDIMLRMAATAMTDLTGLHVDLAAMRGFNPEGQTRLFYPPFRFETAEKAEAFKNLAITLSGAGGKVTEI